MLVALVSHRALSDTAAFQTALRRVEPGRVCWAPAYTTGAARGCDGSQRPRGANTERQRAGQGPAVRRDLKVTGVAAGPGGRRGGRAVSHAEVVVKKTTQQGTDKRADPTDHRPRKAELTSDVSIPDATPDQHWRRRPTRTSARPSNTAAAAPTAHRIRGRWALFDIVPCISSPKSSHLFHCLLSVLIFFAKRLLSLRLNVTSAPFGPTDALEMDFKRSIKASA